MDIHFPFNNVRKRQGAFQAAFQLPGFSFLIFLNYFTDMLSLWTQFMAKYNKKALEIYHGCTF